MLPALDNIQNACFSPPQNILPNSSKEYRGQSGIQPLMSDEDDNNDDQCINIYPDTHQCIIELILNYIVNKTE